MHFPSVHTHCGPSLLEGQPPRESLLQSLIPSHLSLAISRDKSPLCHHLAAEPSIAQRIAAGHRQASGCRNEARDSTAGVASPPTGRQATLGCTAEPGHAPTEAGVAGTARPSPAQPTTKAAVRQTPASSIGPWVDRFK